MQRNFIAFKVGSKEFWFSVWCFLYLKFLFPKIESVKQKFTRSGFCGNFGCTMYWSDFSAERKVTRQNRIVFFCLFLLCKPKRSGVNAKASGWFKPELEKSGRRKKGGAWMSSRVCAVPICRGLMADMLTWRATPWWWTATPRGKYHPPTMTDRWCEWCCCHAEWVVPTTQGLWLEAVRATWGARQWHHSESQSGAGRTMCIHRVSGKGKSREGASPSAQG